MSNAPHSSIVAIPAPEDARELLHRSPLLRELDSGALETLASTLRWWHCPRDADLMAEGDDADTAFLVASGRFEAHSHDVLFNTLVPGDLVGETSLLGGLTRNATVTATRDSIVASIGSDELLSLSRSHPAILLGLTRLVARRWVSRTGARRSHRPPGIVMVVPLTGGADVGDLTARLGAESPEVGSVSTGELVGWLTGGVDRFVHEASEREQAAVLVVVPIDPPTVPASIDMTKLLRQADLILGVMDAAEDVSEPLVRTIEATGRPFRYLDLRAERGSLPVGAVRHGLFALSGCLPALHAERGSAADLSRVARRLTGRSIGVVLGGGGARGFAHIGVLRALSEFGITIDLIGGSSMGAVMAAQAAMGWTPDRMVEENAGRWTRRKMLDPRLPRTSLLRGASARDLLGSFYGDRLIEDLAIEFFCLTADLTTYAPHVARSGPLADWVATSSAVPGVWPPLVDENGHLHVDGGVLNNVPTDVMADSHHGPVVGVELKGGNADLTVTPSGGPGHLSPYWHPTRHEPGIVGLLGRSQQLASLQSQARSGDHADLYLSIDVSDYAFMDFHRVEGLADHGYREACRQLGSLDLHQLSGLRDG